MYLRMFVARDAGIHVSLYVFEVYPCIHPCPYAHLHVSMHVYACKYVCIYSSPYVRMHVSNYDQPQISSASPKGPSQTDRCGASYTLSDARTVAQPQEIPILKSRLPHLLP